MDELLALLKNIEKLLPMLVSVGPEFGGLVVAPLMATHSTNFLKMVRREFRKKYGWEKMHWLIWHCLTWVLAFIYSYVCFQFKYDNIPGMFAVCFVLASLNSAIVEWMHGKVKASGNEDAQAFMNKVVLVQEETVFTKLSGPVTGVTLKADQRKSRDGTRVWTEAEREEARRRSQQ